MEQVFPNNEASTDSELLVNNGIYEKTNNGYHAHDVFISYSHKNKTVADAICHELEANGIRCWYAPRDIKSGEKWAGSIIRAIRECRVFVIIFSCDSNSSDQVLNEVTNAVSFGKIILPFRIDDSKMKDDMIYYLTSRHWLDAITPPLMKHIQTLRDQIHSLLNLPATNKPSTIPGNVKGNESTKQPKPSEEISAEKNLSAPVFHTGEPQIYLGKLGQLYGNSSLSIPLKALSGNALIVGKKGSGKTTFCNNLLAEVYNQGRNFIAFDPYDQCFESLEKRIDRLRHINVGFPELDRFVINSFIPPKGVSFVSYKKFLVMALAISLFTPYNNVIEEALERTYRKFGWDDSGNTKDSKPFGFQEFAEEMEQVIKKKPISESDRLYMESHCLPILTIIAKKYSHVFGTCYDDDGFDCDTDIFKVLKTPTVFDLYEMREAEPKRLFVLLVLFRVFHYSAQNENLGGIVMLDALDQLTIDRSYKHLHGPEWNFLMFLLDQLQSDKRKQNFIIAMSCSEVENELMQELFHQINLFAAFKLTNMRSRKNAAEMLRDPDLSEALQSLNVGEAYVYSDELQQPYKVLIPRSPI